MRGPFWIYLLIAFSITWVIIFGIYFLYRQQTITYAQLNIYFTFGCLGPFLSAIICSRLFYKKTGLRRLFETFNPKRIESKTLALSLSPLLFLIIGYFLYPLLANEWFSFAVTQREFKLTDTASYIGWAAPVIAYPIFEEFGWRGFALPHLQEKFTAFKSSVILSFIWAVWHLPFFLFRFQFSPGIFIGFLFGLFVGAVIVTSIFNFSGGSVLACILFHLTNNIASAFDKNYIVAVVSIGFVILATYLTARYKPENLADRERVKRTIFL